MKNGDWSRNLTLKNRVIFTIFIILVGVWFILLLDQFNYLKIFHFSYYWIYFQI